MAKVEVHHVLGFFICNLTGTEKANRSGVCSKRNNNNHTETYIYIFIPILQNKHVMIIIQMSQTFNKTWFDGDGWADEDAWRDNTRRQLDILVSHEELHQHTVFAAWLVQVIGAEALEVHIQPVIHHDHNVVPLGPRNTLFR